MFARAAWPSAALAEEMAVEEERAVDLASGSEGGETRLLFGRPIKIADNHAVAGLEEGLLDAAQDLGEEDVVEIRQDDQHHVGLLRTKVRAAGIWHVADFAIASKTRLRASGETRSGVASARLTVAVDTSASRATSWMRASARRRVPSLRTCPLPFAHSQPRSVLATDLTDLPVAVKLM